MFLIAEKITEELSVSLSQVNAAIKLLDEGATVPFIARYRKEVTGGLDDNQLRHLEERLQYLRELDERRNTILKSITEQEKLTPALAEAIASADTKSRLEDLYLPYKPKRRTRAQIAREAGLEPLAESLLDNPDLHPEQAAMAFIDSNLGVDDSKAALDGARQILMERFSEQADLIAELRRYLTEHAWLHARVADGKEDQGSKFRDYFEYRELLRQVPSHRALAMFRGRNEGILYLNLTLSDSAENDQSGIADAAPLGIIARHCGISDRQRPADAWLQDVVRWTWKVKLLLHLENELLAELRQRAEEEAIRVFASNLKDLLLAPPAGPKATIGLDPGLRTGVKVAVVDPTGRILDHAAIFPNPPQNRRSEAASVLLRMIKQYQVELIAIGNGTAGRETDRFVADLIRENPDLAITRVMVNEAGASVYSASEYAAREFPDLDVTVRGAISIARRLQDPLAELVKIEPKAIGVGQYQHDVSQLHLARTLNAVVEDCVNAVGVDINTASPALLSQISGLNQALAGNIVEYRDQHGRFTSREQLHQVKRFGEKTFLQAAGFLRIQNGDNPLDNSAVHPESYSVVTKIVNKTGRPVQQLIGDSEFLRQLDPAQFTDEQFGLPTVKDILRELEKPGRDPRPEFTSAQFRDGVETLKDLAPDMILEGTVTNVTNFGAFVDIGVHQDGLVHISAMSHNFIKDPHTLVKTGQVVRVKVMSVDLERKRIALSMRLDDKAADSETHDNRGKPGRSQKRTPPKERASRQGSMAALFAEARDKQRKK